jgi:methionine sulfoxide reductase heme-binding subunit
MDSMRSVSAKNEADQPARETSSSLHGWRLLGWLAVVLLLTAGAMLALDPGVGGIRLLIRSTARTSLLLFCMAFTASAAWKCFPNRLTGWQRRNRRYLGLGFAISHVIHAVAIAAFATLDPAGFQMQSMGSVVAGGIAYVFIVAMAATSFDRTAAWIGPRLWKVLHTSGAYYIWISFMIAFGKRIPLHPEYAAAIAILVMALVFRFLPLVFQRQRVAG